MNTFCSANRCDRFATGCQLEAGRRRHTVRVVIKSGAENTGDAVVGMLSRTVISRVQHPAELRDQQQRNEVSAECPWERHPGKLALRRCASNIVGQYRAGLRPRSAAASAVGVVSLTALAWRFGPHATRIAVTRRAPCTRLPACNLHSRDPTLAAPCEAPRQPSTATRASRPPQASAE